MKREAFDVEHLTRPDDPGSSGVYRVRREAGSDRVQLSYELRGVEACRVDVEVTLHADGVRTAEYLGEVLERLGGMLKIAEGHPFPKSGCTILHAVKDAEDS